MPVNGVGLLSLRRYATEYLANPVMEETVWEQYTVTLQRDPKMGFGIAVSGGRDNPNEERGETSIVVSDVLQGGPADGLLFENDRVVQVNAIPMDGALHSFAVNTLRKCGKVAKITVKRPRKVPINMLNRSPSPEDRVFKNDYNDGYNYEQDRRSVFSGGGGQDHSLERERSGGGHMDSGYKTRERDYDKDYDRREGGRSTERDLSPSRQYRRDGSRGRTLDREHSPDHPYRNDYSPDRRYHSERALDRNYSPDRRYRSEHTLDREYSPDRRYRSERTLEHTNSPDLHYRRDSYSRESYGPGQGHGRDHNFERGHEYDPADPRKYDEPFKKNWSRERLDHSPSPTAMPIPLPHPAQDLEPLEKPLNVLLLKNRPNEEYGLRLGSQLFIKEMTNTGLASRDGNLQEGDIILKINGTVTENLSLSDAGKLIEKSRGKLQLVVKRDRQQVLIRVPPMMDSDSELDGESPSKLNGSRSYPV